MRRALDQALQALERLLRRRERPADGEALLREIAATARRTRQEHRAFAARTGVRIDAERLKRIEAETEEVFALLQPVFSHEPEPSDDPLAGLEPRHAALFAEMLAATPDGGGEMPRAAFVALARDHGLLPGGAIETINDWAFDRMGGTVLDDGDPVGVRGHLMPPTRSQMRRDS